MNFKFDLVREPGEMLCAFSLVAQLTPNITEYEYTQMINEMVRSGYFQLHVYFENKLVAVCGIWIATKIYSGKYLEMDNVVVDENYRSIGIGKIICEKCELIAKANSCKTLMLDAYLENERAHEFYLKHGFIKRGFHFIKKIN